jgi:hypothetical protein
MRRTTKPPQCPRTHPTVWQARLARLFGLCCLLASLAPVGGSQANPQEEAIGYLKKEQSLAESYAGLLKGFGQQDRATYARGIQHYAEAKAEFDGLLEQLLAALRQGESLDTSAAFQQKLEKAANRRVAFTAFIDQEVLTKVPEGTKSLAAILKIAGAIGDVKELVTALKDAGVTIGQWYRRLSGEQERAELVSRLEALRWKPFEAITPLQ